MMMGCCHHHDGEILNGNNGDGRIPNVKHDVFFHDGDALMKKMNDGDESLKGNDDFRDVRNDDLGLFDGVEEMENGDVMGNYGDPLHGSAHDCNGDEGLVRECGFSVYSFPYPWKFHLLNDYWAELAASCVPYGHVLILSNDFWMIQFYCLCVFSHYGVDAWDSYVMFGAGGDDGDV